MAAREADPVTCVFVKYFLLFFCQKKLLLFGLYIKKVYRPSSRGRVIESGKVVKVVFKDIILLTITLGFVGSWSLS